MHPTKQHNQEQIRRIWQHVEDLDEADLIDESFYWELMAANREHVEKRVEITAMQLYIRETTGCKSCINRAITWNSDNIYDEGVSCSKNLLCKNKDNILSLWEFDKSVMEKHENMCWDHEGFWLKDEFQEQKEFNEWVDTLPTCDHCEVYLMDREVNMTTEIETVVVNESYCPSCDKIYDVNSI